MMHKVDFNFFFEFENSKHFSALWEPMRNEFVSLVPPLFLITHLGYVYFPKKTIWQKICYRNNEKLSNLN